MDIERTGILLLVLGTIIFALAFFSLGAWYGERRTEAKYHDQAAAYIRMLKTRDKKLKEYATKNESLSTSLTTLKADFQRMKKERDDAIAKLAEHEKE